VNVTLKALWGTALAMKISVKLLIPNWDITSIIIES
jgi:hypothetical protein